MRAALLATFLFVASSVFAQDVEIAVKPDAIYVESTAANIVPMERVFFHIIVHNASKTPVQLAWLRFDLRDERRRSGSSRRYPDGL